MFYAANLGKSRTNIDRVSGQRYSFTEARSYGFFKGESSGYRQGQNFTWSGQLV
jgi:hypothetical protein